jgi:DNA-binding GntR family transcriptional regulator
MVYHSLMVSETRARDDFRSEAGRVAAVLRDQIVTGERAPGSRLVERDLAAETGVSRVPVRDALRALVAEGLVTPRPNTWAVVRTFTAADVDDLIEVRTALETLAFRLAAQRRTADQLAGLHALVAEEREAALQGDRAGARRAGAGFHEAVVEATASSVVAELFATLRSRMRWLLGQHSALLEMAGEHADLAAAIGEQDADRAETLARTHLVSSRAAALAELDATG